MIVKPLQRPSRQNYKLRPIQTKPINMLVQHHPTLLNATCWPRLNSICWMMLEEVGLSLNLLIIFVQHCAILLAQQCCMMLASFEQAFIYIMSTHIDLWRASYTDCYIDRRLTSTQNVKAYKHEPISETILLFVFSTVERT